MRGQMSGPSPGSHPLSPLPVGAAEILKSTILRINLYTLILILLKVAPSLQVRFSVIGLDPPLVILLGEDAVLPCHLSPQINAENMTIRWFKSKYQNLVHLYQNREDRFEKQMAEYRSRTTLIKDGIEAGSVSLIIHDVQPSDSGLYTCFYDTGPFYEEAGVELKVAALGSKPHIYLEDLQNGEIRVVCGSPGWYPEPEAQWKDDSGKNISSSVEVKAANDTLLFHVKATYIFSGPPSALSCCIRNPLLAEWKQSTVHIRDVFFQRISSCILSRLLISASFTVLGILLISWTFYFFNEQRKCSGNLSEKLGKLLEEIAAVTLDPDTSHRWLLLFEDERSVRDGNKAQDLPDTPQRFTFYNAVLAREGLSSGRHYWEVEVGDKTRWTLGVCDEAASRNGWGRLAPEDGYWTVWLREGEYKALTSPPTLLTPRVPPRAVGLFLDYEAGRLSIYNADDGSPLFSFSGAPFSPTLRPYFNPGFRDGGRNAGALRIRSVTRWEEPLSS
ncbi:butyrophilin subfamily 1 member A1-like isoform X2 [Lissotriton helveticus]